MIDSGILPEHLGAPPQEDDNGGTYQPTDDEKRELKLVEKLFEKAKKHRQQYDYKWLEFYRMFRGSQWKEQRPVYRHAEVINLLFQTIQSQVPIITDTRPKFEFLPQEPTDFELSEIMNDLAQSDWARYNWQATLTEVIYEGHIYGTGLSCMKYCPETDNLEYLSSDPFYCFPDPSAFDVNSNCDYFIYAEPMDVVKIRRKWPDKGYYVKPDLTDLMRGSKTDLGPIKFKSPVDRNIGYSPDGGEPSGDSSYKDKALTITIYMKSDEMVLEEKTDVDPTTGTPNVTKLEMLKYPNGKKVTIANGVVLESCANPYDDGEYPYQRWPNYILPREFWGESEIAQLMGPQRTFNKLVSFALDVLTLMGNPIWVVDNTADIDTENLFNRPGQVVEKAPGSEVRREEGVQLQPFVLQIIDRMKEWFDQVSGSQDITRGLNPSGVTAASAIADLQNAAQTRLRQKSRNLDCYLQNLGQQYMSRVMQFYTAPRVFRITGKDDVQKYFKFHVSDDEQTGQKVANIERFSPEGQSLGIQSTTMQGSFDVRVTTGSSLPFSKTEKETRLYGLFDRQIIDAQEVLKGLDYPNYEAVLQRQQEKAAQMAQAQAQPGAPPAA